MSKTQRQWLWSAALTLAFLLGIGANAFAATAGSTAGNLSVTPAGTASYNIPIIVPPGSAGMSPSLALQYTNGGANGLLGVGWSLTGLSTISRCARTIAQDGVHGSVDLTVNDRFCLDGQRLMLKPPQTVYGAANSVYGTELETLSKVTAIGVTGSGPTSFTVLHRDGTTLTYGATADSQMTSTVNSVTSVVNWAVNKVMDARGNYYTVSYTKDTINNQYYVKQIDYTGNAVAPALSPYNSVRFSYDLTARSDVESGYTLGTKYMGTARMSSIQTYAGSTLVRTYNLGYDTSAPTGRSRLTTVTECDGTAGTPNCYTPTTFSYSNDLLNLGGTSYTTGITAPSTPGVASVYIAFEQWVDINGDGRPDYCYAAGVGTPPNMASGSAYYPSYELRCLLLTATGFGSNILVASGLNYPITAPVISFVDINADGLADVCVNYNCYLSTGTGLNTATPITIPIPLISRELNWFVDLNADGLFDYCYVDTTGSASHRTALANTNVMCSMNTGSSFSAPVLVGSAPELNWSAVCEMGEPALPIPYYCPINFATWADISGDGIPSFCVRDTPVIWPGNKLAPAASNVNLGAYHCRKYLLGTLGPDIATPASADLGWEDSQIFVDVNGDGKADFCRVLNDKTPACTLSTGTGWGETITSTATFTVANTAASNHAQVNWADINGDGKVDVCGQYYDTISLGQTIACLPIQSVASGVQFSPTKQLVTPGLGGVLMDWNGDGLPTYRNATGPQNYPDLLVGVTNGLGASSTLTYSTLADTGAYTKGTLPPYPQMAVQDSSHVVRTMTSSDGIGGTNTTSYHYYYGVSDLWGRGFLGYQVMDTLYPSGLLSQQWSLQNFPYTGNVATSLSLRADTSAVLGRTDTWYGYKDLGGGRAYPYATNSTAKAYDYDGSFLNWVEGTSTPTFDTANPYDAILLSQAESSRTKDSTGTLDGYSTATTTAFLNTPATWILGLPTSVTITKAAPGLTSQTRNTVMSYYANGLLKQSIVEPNNGGSTTDTTLKLQTDYTYDPKFGNLATATVSGANIVTRKTADLTYDTNGQFVSTSKNALGHSETRTYDKRFGSIASLTGPNLLTTNWTYDGFGRMATETRADGTRTTVTYYTCPSCWGVSYLSYYTTKAETLVSTGATLSPTETTGYDLYSRPWESNHLSFDGVTPVYQDWRYDNLGRLSTVYAPYKPGDTYRPTTTSYDPLNRPTSITYPDGSITTLAYNGLTSSKTNSKNQTTSSTRNSQGQTVSVINAQGTADQSSIGYAYDVWGNLAQTTDAFNNSVKMTYDLRGRKKTLNDPDMGNWSYTYDNLGLLKTQTDAKNQQSLFTYDVLDRMKIQSTPSLVSNWWYESNKAGTVCAMGKGKLCEATSTNSYSRKYSYDSLGRLSTLSEIIDKPTAPYVTTRTYDGAGRLDTVTYPNAGTTAAPRNLKVKYNYTALGYLQSITNATTSALIYQVNNLNADGRIWSENFGNGVTQSNAFEPSTGRLGAIGVYGPSSSTPNLMSLGYTYDTLANVATRNDAITGVKETFGYDNLNRLSTVNLLQPNQTTPDVTTVGYNAIGNITSKNTVGPNVALNVSASPTAIAQSQTTAGTMTGSVTVSLLAANAPTYPITYSWGPTANVGISASPAAGTLNTGTLSLATSFTANVANGAVLSTNYTLTLTDAAGRVGTVTVPISFAVAATLNAPSFSPASATGSRNNPGAAAASTTLSYSGGKPPYNITWTRLTGSRISPPANTTGTTATSLAASFSATLAWAENFSEQFQATVTDAVNQSKTASITVSFTSPTAPTVSISPNPLTINAATSGATASGTATATGLGGVPPYTYSWASTGGSGVSISGATAATPSFSSVLTYAQHVTQTYQVTLTDAAGNTATSPTALTVNGNGPAPPALSVSVTPAASNTSVKSTNASVVALAATPAGGVAPYTYAWTFSGTLITGSFSSTTVSNPTTTSRLSLACDTETANYTVTVTDAVGQTASATATVTVTSTTTAAGGACIALITPPPTTGGGM